MSGSFRFCCIRKSLNSYCHRLLPSDGGGSGAGEACPKSSGFDNMCAVKCGPGGPRKEEQ